MNNGHKKAIFMIAVLTLIALSSFLWPKQGGDLKEEMTATKQVADVVATNSIRKTTETSKEEEFTTKVRETYNRIKPLKVLGKTVDTAGCPVPGVEVQIRWETADFLIGLAREHNQHIWLISNGQGKWIFDIQKPSRAFVADARKKGYVFEKNRSTFGDVAYIRKTNKTEVVEAVVCMRKKKEEVLLLKSPGNGHGDTLLRSKTGEASQSFIDILHGVGGSEEKTVSYADVLSETRLDKTNTCWVISFRTPQGEDGIQVSNEKLYEAPESGYEKNAVLRIPSALRYQSKEAFLYLRSRPLGVYSRIELKINAAGGEGEEGRQELLIEKQSLTNPYGERSLEDAEELRKFTFARDELIQEAKKAIESGTLPMKPENLAKHMEERDKILEDAWRNPRR